MQLHLYRRPTLNSGGSSITIILSRREQKTTLTVGVNLQGPPIYTPQIHWDAKLVSSLPTNREKLPSGSATTPQKPHPIPPQRAELIELARYEGCCASPQISASRPGFHMTLKAVFKFLKAITWRGLRLARSPGTQDYGLSDWSEVIFSQGVRAIVQAPVTPQPPPPNASTIDQKSGAVHQPREESCRGA